MAPAASPSIERSIGRPAMPPTPSSAEPRWSAMAASAMMAKSPWRRATSSKADALAFDDRKPHRRDQLIGRARGGEHVLLKGLRGEHAFAAFLRAQHHRAAGDRERQRNFRAWIGMRDRAAHRASVAGLEVADEGQRRGEQRQLQLELRPRHQFVLRHRGADLDDVAAIADGVERGDARNIDQRRRIDQPQIEHRKSDWPPARMRASSPYSASSAKTSSTVSGRM